MLIDGTPSQDRSQVVGRGREDDLVAFNNVLVIAGDRDVEEAFVVSNVLQVFDDVALKVLQLEDVEVA